MRFVSLGGGNEVGASCYFIEIDGVKLLIDAGIRVNMTKETGTSVDALPDLAMLQEMGGLDAVLVTHAHLDHIGALPLVHQAYPSVPIFATNPTVHLMRVLLADTLKIMSIKAEQEMECPLYSEELVARMFTRVVSVPLGATIKVTEGITADFFPAGHIMGAAMIGLTGAEGRVLFTGDISGSGQRTIPGMITPKFRPHLLVMEATYGNRLHANRQREEKGLAEAVADVVANGGHALIPAFALGRAQEVILLIQAYQQANRIPKFPIWVDGMVRSICNTYINFPDCLYGPIKRVINNGGNPFYREKSTARPVTNSAQREKVLAGAPSCIISSSGMLSGGPSQYYASRLAKDEKNAILLCGYQDEESPGHKMLSLVNGTEKEMTLGNTIVSVKCRVEKYGLSAHADSGELTALAEKLKPRRIILVHGDKGARGVLSTALSLSHSVHLPDNGEAFDFTFTGLTVNKVTTKDVSNGLGKGKQINLQELWNNLHKNKGDKQMYTVQDLAVLWYGSDVTPEQQELTDNMIKEDKKYFAADWKHTYFYRVKRTDQVALDKKRTEIMTDLKYRLPGNLVVLRDTNGAVRAGICYSVEDNGFEAWKVGQKGTSHPPECLLEIVDKWSFSDDKPNAAEEKVKLHQLLLKSKTVYKKLKPQEICHCLADEKVMDISVDELINILGLASNTVNRLAVAWRLNTHPEIFERVAENPLDVSYRVNIVEIQVGISEAEEPELVDRMEQNSVLNLLDEILPLGSGLYKKGVDRTAGKIVLYFEFPETAAVKYKEQLSSFSSETGWEIDFNTETHQGALFELARRIIPESWIFLKNPSVRRETKQVVLKCTIPSGQDMAEFNRIAALYKEQTGFQLTAESLNSSIAVSDFLSFHPSNKELTAARMEINTTYAIIKERLADDGAVVYKSSKKNIAGNEIVEVSFISPQIGEHYTQTLQALAAETGWRIKINPEPKINEIISYTRSVIPLEWGIKKEPGVFKDRQEVQVKLVNPPVEDDPLLQEIMVKIKLYTGYQLVVKKA